MVGATVGPKLVRDIIGIQSSTYISIILFLTTLSFWFLTVTKTRKINIYLNKNYLFALVGLTVFVSLEMIDSIYSGYGRKATLLFLLNSLMLMGLAVMLYFQEKIWSNLTKSLLQPYVHISLYITTTGVIGYFLIITNTVDYEKWQFINEFMKKGEHARGGQLYSMPMYLTFLLTGADSFSFFGVKLIRLSGLSIEPNAAAFFSAPFLFIAGLYFNKKPFLKAYSIIISLLFLLFCGSLTSILLLLIIYIVYALKKLKISFYMGIVFILAITLLSQITFTNKEESGTTKNLLSKLHTPSAKGASKNIMSPIVNSKDLLGHGLMAPKDGGDNINERGVVGVTYYYFMLISASLIALYFFFKSKENPEAYLLILYVIGHSFKSPEHILSFPVTIYFIIVFALLISRKIAIENNIYIQNNTDSKSS